MSRGISFEKHDHASCVNEALDVADQFCKAHKLQLTKVRRRVLEILLGQHKAIGAYDILAQLKAEGLGSQPPVVYRALDFLVSHNFVHKVEKLNAYVACSHSGQHHSPAFMICRMCDAVAEMQTSPKAGVFGATAREIGFEIENAVIEAEGICPSCQKDDAAQ
ncbi:Fur family transcriptional regulator [Parasulfitobacter algicola]|uniref:Transcriptional repressor n=1 Tax=Parasulfitobacter algicola TaxID=2614809 RepID=A0ABX2IPX5_9RHOB|nr:transcriptional repressor [Sulfitobacter algicola]NSX54410.1 transcriptional repressor [Sulfitobacter algicola]